MTLTIVLSFIALYYKIHLDIVNYFNFQQDVKSVCVLHALQLHPMLCTAAGISSD